MSFKVLVIPEDPTLNGHILKPLAERLLEDAGKPNAKVKVLDNLLSGAAGSGDLRLCRVPR